MVKYCTLAATALPGTQQPDDGGAADPELFGDGPLTDPVLAKRCRNLPGEDVDPEQWLFDLNSYAGVGGRKGRWRAAAKQVFQQSKARPIFDSFLKKLAAD